jgi:excisionase family DNA binding protein
VVTVRDDCQAFADAISAAFDRDANRLQAALDRLAGALGERSTDHAPDSFTRNQDGWLRTKEAAAYLGMSTKSLHKLTAANAVPFAQEAPGYALWFRRSELDKWRRAG